MKATHSLVALTLPAAIALAAPAAAQIIHIQAAGFATISMAGLGNTTTVASESRLPILSRDVSYERAQAGEPTLHLRAVGRRGPVRQLDIDVRAPRAGQRYELGPNAAATLRVRLDQGAEIVAETGRGHVTITSIDAQRVVGTYEGTFRGQATPVVLRGRFEASFPRPTAQGGTTSPGQ